MLYLGKCKHCGTVTRGESVKVPGAGGTMTDRLDRDDVRRVGAVYEHRFGNAALDCRVCGLAVRNLKPIRGTVKPNVACNAKCLSSKGPTCECSCGGKNHGASYERMGP